MKKNNPEQLSFEKIQKRIRSSLSSLTETDRRIALYILENHNLVALSTISELSDSLKVGRASVVRLVQKLGYKSFSSLKAEMKTLLHNEIRPMESFHLALDRQTTQHRYLHPIADQEVRNINATLSMIDEKDFKQAVQMLQHADEIFTVGMGISSYLAGMAAYLLRRTGLRAVPLTQIGNRFTEQLLTIDKNDLLLAFSMPPYLQETLDAAEFARQQGAKVIGVTNSPTSPIVRLADLYLLAKTESKTFTNSVCGLIVLVTALAAEVATQNPKRSQDTFQKILTLQSKRH
ncbi:MAG: MurR/RpiR family transcriptional regulator [bacterium]